MCHTVDFNIPRLSSFFGENPDYSRTKASGSKKRSCVATTDGTGANENLKFNTHYNLRLAQIYGLVEMKFMGSSEGTPPELRRTEEERLWSRTWWICNNNNRANFTGLVLSCTEADFYK